MRNPEGKAHGLVRRVWLEDQSGLPKGTISETTYKNASLHGINVQINKAAIVSVFLNDAGSFYGHIEFFMPSFKLKSRKDEGTGMLEDFKPENFQP